MNWILTICIGVTGATCYRQVEYEYKDHDTCYEARSAIKDQIGKGYAICAPKLKETK